MRIFRIIRIISGYTLIAGLIVALYIFRFAPQRTILHAPDGSWVFGYNAMQGRWLFNEIPRYEPRIDGPHIFYEKDSVKVLYMKEEGKSISLAAQNFTTLPDSLICIADNSERSSFFFHPQRSHTISPCVYPIPAKLLVVSDIEGYFKGFVQLLTGNGVVDKDLHWIYGNNHLVLTGDMMDRGDNVTQCLWLIYRLEQEAIASGGKVHYILGNHEQLNLQGSAGYAAPKYIELIRQAGIPYKALYNSGTELGRWLRTKNVMEKIGDILFVHGGISTEVARQQYTIEDINNICRQHLGTPAADLHDSDAKRLLGNMGILWYRGMVSGHRNYEQMKEAEVDTILKCFSAKAIAIGHTITDDVSADYHGKVLRTDIKHNEKGAQALCITGGRYYRADTLGHLTALQ